MIPEKNCYEIQYRTNDREADEKDMIELNNDFSGGILEKRRLDFCRDDGQISRIFIHFNYVRAELRHKTVCLGELNILNRVYREDFRGIFICCENSISADFIGNICAIEEVCNKINIDKADASGVLNYLFDCDYVNELNRICCQIGEAAKKVFAKERGKYFNADESLCEILNGINMG